MTNICPQHPNLNGGDWHELEKACRRWALEGTIYIVCGPILYKNPSYAPIGKEHKIRVPEAFFKVILAGVEEGRPRAIGFIYKNTAGNRPLDSYVNSIDQVERITGMDFFPALPDDIEQRIEKECNVNEWR
jgi:endonuclease G